MLGVNTLQNGGEPTLCITVIDILSAKEFFARMCCCNMYAHGFGAITKLVVSVLSYTNAMQKHC